MEMKKHDGTWWLHAKVMDRLTGVSMAKDYGVALFLRNEKIK